MHAAHHRFTELFQQLGLPADPSSIAAFIRTHAPLPSELCLSQAPFWSPAQAALLSEAVARDEDWAELVDQLDAALRATG